MFNRVEREGILVGKCPICICRPNGVDSSRLDQSLNALSVFKATVGDESCERGKMVGKEPGYIVCPSPDLCHCWAGGKEVRG